MDFCSQFIFVCSWTVLSAFFNEVQDAVWFYAKKKKFKEGKKKQTKKTSVEAWGTNHTAKKRGFNQLS